MRPSVALIYVAMAVIAISLTAMLHRMTALPLEVAGMFGAILFFVLAALDQSVSRVSERRAFQRQLELADHSLQDAFNEIDMIRSRLVALETDTQQTVDAAMAPVQQDLQAVGALLAQVTEAVADTDHRVATIEEQMGALARRGARRAAEAHAIDAAAPQAPGAAPAPPSGPTPAAAAAAATAKVEQAARAAQAAEEEASRALLKRVAVAVENERIEVALQSVVTLPQRRARAYATLFSLKLDGAGTLDARHVVPAVEAAGVSIAYDKAVAARCLALAHKFAARESASIVFMPVTGSAFMQSRFADWLVQTMTNNRELAGRLVVELSQKDVRAFSPIDFDLLSTLADLGFRMSVTQLSDARSDLFDLSRHGFRYAKAPVSLFLGKDAGARSDIHPEDLSDLAARNGMDLIVDQVESEAQIVELLEFRLKYAQGNLFARPRVVEVEPHPLLDQAQPQPQPQAQPVPDPAKAPPAARVAGQPASKAPARPADSPPGKAARPDQATPPVRPARALSRTA